MVAFRGVVVNDVQDDLDPCGVECSNHLFEFVDLFAPPTGARVFVVWSEESDRVVTPVVAQRSLEQAIVLDELVDRHELHRCHTKR